MKWFWIILGLVILAAFIIVWQESGAPSAVRPETAAPPAPIAASEPVRPSATPATKAGPERAAPANASGPAAAPSAPAAPATSSVPAAEKAPPTTTPPAERPLPKIAHAEVVRGSIERLPDGTIVADKRFRILGAGTPGDPYRVSWECLQSAQDTYVPRLGENRLPERIAMLDGAVVRIEGYLAFPLLAKEAKEIIVMLNQWDGCCIGVPPTPYDSIEVRLAEPIPNTKRHASFTYGAITGRFKVEPYLVDNWLAGLYLLEEAHYEPEEF